uniref:Uncharacterized protein n=1 Tax=Anopheles melas TaxID=34690 RepID=A0A182TQ45_9DIPT
MSSVENAENGVGKYSYQTVYYIITNNNNSTEEGESDQVENLHAITAAVDSELTRKRRRIEAIKMQGQIPGAAAVQVQGGSPQAAALAAQQQQQQQQSISVKMDPAQLSSAVFSLQRDYSPYLSDRANYYMAQRASRRVRGTPRLCRMDPM